MFIAIQPDVPLQIILEVLQSPTSLRIQFVHDSLKNIGQQIFPPKRKSRSHCTEVAGLDDFECLLNKTTSRFGHCGGC